LTEKDLKKKLDDYTTTSVNIMNKYNDKESVNKNSINPSLNASVIQNSSTNLYKDNLINANHNNYTKKNISRSIIHSTPTFKRKIIDDIYKD